MTKPFMFEKPIGMRDTLPSLYEAKKQVREKMHEEIYRWGYQFLETPTLEFYDTVGSSSATLDQQLFKLLDQQGHTLVLRPDMTAPIARVAASRLKDVTYPLRLAYDSHLFRAQQREGGRPAEFEQVGVECIGDATPSADAEVIALMVSVLKKAGLQTFRVAVGHIGFVATFLQEVLGSKERASVLQRYLYEKNYVGFRNHVKQLPLSSIDQKRLLDMLELRGGKEAIEEAKQLAQTKETIAMVEEVERVWDILEDYDVTQYITIDFNLVSHMSYYTGIVFEGFADHLGFPLASGGRYDELLHKFDRPAAATGFGIRLDRLMESLKIKEETKAIECIIFSDERRKEAIELAKEKRAAGTFVALQNFSGIEDVDALTKRYEQVTYCIGKAGSVNNR